jgi:uncharacterized protein (TIGR02145 family)
VNAVCKSLDDLENTDIQTDANTQKLHIFSNIIDVELFSIIQLSDFIKQKFEGNNQFVCVSPFFGSTNSRANRLDEFMNLIATSNVYSENLGKNDWINGWTCSIRVYAFAKIGFFKNAANAEEILSLQIKAENGDPEAQNNLGKSYDKGMGVEQDHFQAVKWFLLAAEQGFASAQFNLGICYKIGEGIKQDYFQAVKWYRLAAEQGISVAQLNLGICYENGEGIEQDYFQAVKWFRLAADQGVSAAHKRLGICYENGKGVEKDFSQAFKWYQLAANHGNLDAYNNLGICYKRGKGVEKDNVLAVKYFLIAAEQGISAAQCNLGICYKNGEGIEKNYIQAVKWYRLAAEQGNRNAQFNLGKCYLEGYGVGLDYDTAAKWLNLAAEKGIDSAQYLLGLLYSTNSYKYNETEAAKWYELAAKKGNKKAQYNLGNCYYNGKGVILDKSEALKWYKLSAEQGYESAIEKIKDLSIFTQNAHIDYVKPEISNTVTDIEGNVYKTVRIGNQIWMAENLRVSRYRNGDLIPNEKNDYYWKFLDSGAWCNYENLPENDFKYGKLYNWYAVDEKRGLAPNGWHIPSDEEWQILIDYLGGAEIAGGKLKEKGTLNWEIPNKDTTNESGFSALPGGTRYTYTDSFVSFGDSGSWWSSTELKMDTFCLNAWERSLLSYASNINRENVDKAKGNSIRCVKNNEI